MSAAATDVAIVGMAGRFPGAPNVDALWRNVRAGVDSIVRRSDEELAAEGVPEDVRRSGLVGAAATLDDVDTFDAPFFSITPGEADILDPQHRLLLECAWAALEHAGYDPETTRGTVGVYAGTSMSSYLGNLTRHPEVLRAFNHLQLMIANDKDHVAMRVAYKLNLKGPAVGVQSACSTGLVAVHLACESLLSRQCDMALAGGVTVRVSPSGGQSRGYVHVEGAVTSPDGYCRPFDARANGTIFGNGLAVVVLKRLRDALADGDFIHAVIKGSAINNDGAARVGYTAPSADGQALVIAEALAVAGIEPETVGYIEAHGTGTPLGDPIEFAALKRVFGRHAASRGSCALGSVKANVGHLETAAGITGLIKVVQALRHREIPPHVHFATANPNIDLSQSPFHIPTALAPWPAGRTPRRAGVSSFGMGGTNAHVVLEEAPPRQSRDVVARPWHLLQLSARSAAALETRTDHIVAALAGPLDGGIDEVVHTLHAGRRSFQHRRFVVCRHIEDGRSALQSREAGRVHDARHDGKAPAVAFMFPGQGAQYADMARELYDVEPVFREHVDGAAATLAPIVGRDLRSLIFCTGDRAAADRVLDETAVTQPALFAIEYALARLLMSWGIVPDALIGHSLGEYVAATLAGVFTEKDALMLVAARGRVIQRLPRGAMLAIALPERDVTPLIDDRIALAAVNGPSSCVVAGSVEAVDEVERRLGTKGIGVRRLHSSHAFHSSIVDAAVRPFTDLVAAVPRAAPSIKWISNVTGTWITDAEARDPAYWGRHLRQPVRFADGVRTLAENPGRLFLEVGPGRILGTLVRQQQHTRVIATMRAAQESGSDSALFLTALGRLWLSGVPIRNPQPRSRVPLPTYPFERRRYWIDPPSATASTAPAASATSGEPRAGRTHFQVPTWVRTAPSRGAPVPATWVLWGEPGEWAARLHTRLSAGGGRVVSIHNGPQIRRPGPAAYEVRPNEIDDVRRAIAAADDGQHLRVLFVAGLEKAGTDAASESVGASELRTLLDVARVLAERPGESELWLLADAAHDVESADRPNAYLAAGAGGVVSRADGRRLSFHVLDVGADADVRHETTLDAIVADLVSPAAPAAIAYRNGQRWVRLLAPDPTAGASGRMVPASPAYLIGAAAPAAGDSLLTHVAEPGVRLALVGGDALWPRDVVERARAAGADVFVCDGTGSEDAARRILDEGLPRFGVLHAVIFCTGDDGADGGAEASASPAAGDVAGRLAAAAASFDRLAEVAERHPFDVRVIWSSRSAVERDAGWIAGSIEAEFIGAHASRRNAAATTAWRRVVGLGACGGDAVREAIWANGSLELVVAGDPRGSTIDQAARAGSSSSPSGGAPAGPEAGDRSDAVHAVAAIWQELLGCERVGARDHFFELGGDSVLATQMASRIRERCRVPLRLDDVLTEPTVEAIARRIRALATGDRESTAVQLEPVRRDGPLPVSFAQQRLFFLHQLVPDSPFYNVPVAVRVAGRLDREALVRAVHAIVQRHEVLRTTLMLEGGQPMQRVHDDMPPDVRWLDVEAEPEAARATRADAVVRAAATDPFDLVRGPMVRVALVRMGPDLHHLAIVMHHIVCDAWSIGIFLRELTILYTAYARGDAVSLAPLSIQYADVAVYERCRFEGERLQKELDYWTGRLAGAAPLTLRGARPVDGGSLGAAGVEPVRLAAETAVALKRFAREEGTTLFTVLLSIFSIVLHQHSGQDDIVVGTDVANRGERATEELIGFFVNQLVLRIDLSGHPTFRELARRVHRTTVEAYGHQELPFDRLVEALNPVRDARSTPLFNVKFVLQNAPVPRLELPELVLAPLEADTGAAKFDILVNLEEISGGVAGRLEYNAERFAPTTMGTLMRAFEAVARAVAADADLRLTDLEARVHLAARPKGPGTLVDVQRQLPLPGARRRSVTLPSEPNR